MREEQWKLTLEIHIKRLYKKYGRNNLEKQWKKMI